MKVLILCGGQGTRLREETEFRPKPLVEVGRRPILWHIMKLYAHHGFREFVLCLGYRGKMIKDYFLNYEAMNNDFTICLGQRHSVTLHDAHEELGEGLRFSWPKAGRRSALVPAYSRLDHALLFDADATAIQELPALGSDHTAFSVRVRPRQPDTVDR